MKISRRDSIKLIGLSGLGLTACSTLGANKSSVKTNSTNRATLKTSAGLDFNPMDRTRGTIGPKAWSGDNPDRTHLILWNKDGYIASRGGKLPDPEESVPVVIVGGGISGIFSAWLLRDLKPIVLERAERFGGNARGEAWDDIDYGIGAAYFMEPEVGSDIHNLLTETGVLGLCRKKTFEDPVWFNGKKHFNFWEGETDPSHSAQFKKLHEHFKNMDEGKNGLVFPDIPFSSPENRKVVLEMDKLTLHSYLKKVAGQELHPHIATAIEHFCWSAMGASMTELSAAAGMNFLAGEFGAVMVPPGGNGAVAEHVLNLLNEQIGSKNLRSGSVVFDVKVQADHCIVTYEDALGSFRSIKAKSVIMACPKFAASKILSDIEPERANAIRQLRYHSYIVCNVLLNKPLKDDFYDIFMLADGKVDLKDLRKSADSHKTTDVVLGTYARPHPSRSILTLYRALPFPGSRPEIYAPTSWEKYQQEFQKEVIEKILPVVGASQADIADLRLARWGHPLPAALAGQLANGVMDQIRKPFKNRVFFVEQDNWMLPAFETSVTEALTYAPLVRKIAQA